METLQGPELAKPIVGMGIYSVNGGQELVGAAQDVSVANEQVRMNGEVIGHLLVLTDDGYGGLWNNVNALIFSRQQSDC